MKCLYRFGTSSRESIRERGSRARAPSSGSIPWKISCHRTPSIVTSTTLSACGSGSNRDLDSSLVVAAAEDDNALPLAGGRVAEQPNVMSAVAMTTQLRHIEHLLVTARPARDFDRSLVDARSHASRASLRQWCGDS